MNSLIYDLLFKAKNVADTTAKKAESMCEVSKYKLESVSINNEIRNIYEELGAAVYSMMKNGYENRELIDGLTDDIDALHLRLSAVTEKIDELKKLSRCPVCGTKNSPNNIYCTRCGTRLRSEFDDEAGDDEDYSDNYSADYIDGEPNASDDE